MKRIALSVAIAVFFSPGTSAAEEALCAEGATTEQVRCLAQRLKVLDGELNRVYQLALETIPTRNSNDSRKEQEQLRKAQMAWLKYKDENCTLIGGLEGGSSLSVTHFAAVCEEKEVRQRIEFLRGIADGKYLH